MRSSTFPNVQVAFTAEGRDTDLRALMDCLQHLINRAAAALRQVPPLDDAALEQLLLAHEPAFPTAAVSELIAAASLYAGNRHAGLRGGSVPLPHALLKVRVSEESAQIWTPTGWAAVKLAPGNYQRHLLRRGHPVRGERLLMTKRGWALRMSYALDARGPSAAEAPFPSLPAGNVPAEERPSAPSLQATVLEREGDFTALRALLLAEGPEGAVDHARLAFCELLVGDVDVAELSLMRLSGQAGADARVALGLSILAGRRGDADRRLSEARRGLAAQPDGWTRPWLLCSGGRALVELGEAPQALELVEEALKAVEPADLRGRARALYFLQGTLGALDDFVGQERVAREALRLFELLNIDEERLSVLMDLAYRRFLGNDPAEARHLIDRAVETLERLDDPRLPSALLVRAEIVLLGGHFGEARLDLARALDFEKTGRQERLGTALRAYLLECRWRLGELDVAAFALETSALRVVSDFDRTVVQFYRGLALWLEGDTQRSRVCFENVVGGVALLDSFRLRATAFLLDLDRQAGQLSAARAQPLLDLLERIGGDLTLELDAALLAPLYQELGTLGLGRRLARLVPAVITEQTLVLTTLGNFSLQIGSDAVPLRLTKGRELLVWLAIHGEGSRDALQDALWDGDRRTGVGSYFKQAVRAVREALLPYLPKGQEAVIFEDGRYRLSKALQVDLDVGPFLDGAASARNLETALGRWAGPFLDGLDTGWVTEIREQVQHATYGACMDLAREAQPREAPVYYGRATELDPLSDEAWAGLIGAWERLGDASRVRRSRLARQLTFQSELGEAWREDG